VAAGEEERLQVQWDRQEGPIVAAVAAVEGAMVLPEQELQAEQAEVREHVDRVV
jgi:hypothetical protein